MNIFAAIKKAINSNLNKPLNITLDEIKTEINDIRGDFCKSTRKVINKIGVPYNTNHTSKVITNSDTPIVSVNGVGRILEIIPVTKYTSSGEKNGTASIIIDGADVLNCPVTYAGKTSDTSGIRLVDYIDNHKNSSFCADIFGNTDYYYVSTTPGVLANPSAFFNKRITLVTPNGIPFKHGFSIRLTQTMSQDITLTGVIVVYELYE